MTDSAARRRCGCVPPVLRPALDQVREATEVLAAAATWRDEAIISAHEAGESVTAIAREAGVGRPAIYRLLARQD